MELAICTLMHFPYAIGSTVIGSGVYGFVCMSVYGEIERSNGSLLSLTERNMASSTSNGGEGGIGSSPMMATPEDELPVIACDGAFAMLSVCATSVGSAPRCENAPDLGRE